MASVTLGLLGIKALGTACVGTVVYRCLPSQTSETAMVAKKTFQTNGENPVLKKEEATPPATPQAPINDQFILKSLEEDKCFYGMDVEELKKQVEAVFERNPTEKLFYKDLYERCLKKATDKDFEKTSIATKMAAGTVATVGGIAVVNEGIKHLHEFRHIVGVSSKENDAYVIRNLESLKSNGYEPCKEIPDIEEFQKTVEEVFKRNKAHKLFLWGDYKKCVEVRKQLA